MAKNRAKLPFLTLVAAISVAALQPEDNAPALIARIEAAQTPNRAALDGFTLPELMRRFHVPGLSIAVIKDFKNSLVEDVWQRRRAIGPPG